MGHQQRQCQQRQIKFAVKIVVYCCPYPFAFQDIERAAVGLGNSEKFKVILTVLLAIICFGETSNLMIKLIATAVLGVGILLMVEKKKTEQQAQGRSWMIYAVLAAVFAALIISSSVAFLFPKAILSLIDPLKSHVS